MTRILSVSYKPEMEDMGPNADSLAGVRHPMSMAIQYTYSDNVFAVRQANKERVARRETKRLVYKLKILGRPVTSKVRSSAENP